MASPLTESLPSGSPLSRSLISPSPVSSSPVCVSPPPSFDYSEIVAKLIRVDLSASPTAGDRFVSRASLDESKSETEKLTASIARVSLFGASIDSRVGGKEDLATIIYRTCYGNPKIKEVLELGTGSPNDRYFTEEVLPQLVRVRKEAMKQWIPGEVGRVSSKEEYMQFHFGKASLRIFPDGSTFIILPKLEPMAGGLKKLKYGILISPDEDTASIKVIAKLKNKIIQVKCPDQSIKRTTVRKRNLPVFISSFKLMASLPDHPNILRLIILLHKSGKDKYEVIMDICDGGDLFDFLEPWADEYDGRAVTRLDRDSNKEIISGLQYLREITSAMKHIYDYGCYHRDLKPENVMFQKLADGNSKAVLIDFDLAILKGESEKKPKAGTHRYIPIGATCNNLNTELYALGRVMHFDRRGDDKDGAPSLRELFKVIEFVEGRRGSSPLIGRTVRLNERLASLSGNLLTGVITDYDSVLSELDSIEAEFTGIGGGSGGASSHTSSAAGAAASKG